MAPPITYDLAGRVVLTVADPDPQTADVVRSEMDPYVPGEPSGAGPEVRLECVPGTRPAELLELQGPAGDGVLSGSDGGRLYILSGGRACAVPDALGERPARFDYEPGFPVARIFGPLVRPAFQVAMLDAQAVALHAAAVEIDGAGVVIAGWSESGKTETALAFMEDGARFVSDKWAVLGPDRTVSAFPIGVGVRHWVLRYLPRLRSSLSGAARRRLALARAATTGGGALARAAPKRSPAILVDGLDRAVALAGRVRLAPSELRAAYGQAPQPPPPVPVRALALLTTVPGTGPHAERAEPAWAAARLARSAAVERRAYFALRERARYALPDRPAGAVEEVVERERVLLERALGTIPVISVRAAFPTDPRPVASAISRCL